MPKSPLLKSFLPKIPLLLPVFAAIALIGCGRESVYDPSYPESLTLKVYHLGAYSSKRAEEEKEIPGTQFQTNQTWSWAKQGAGYRLVKTLDTLMGRGYHKNSMPNELERKISVTLDFDAELAAQKVTGYDSLHTVMKRIPQAKPEWRQQLLRLTDTSAMQVVQKDLWRLFTFLPRRQPLMPGQALDIAALNQRLEGFKADSAKFLGRRPRFKKSCLDLEVYFHRQDSLLLLREQFLNSTVANRKMRNAKPGEAKVAGTYALSLDKRTGLPCYFSITEIGDLVLRDTVGKTDIPIQLIRFEEDVIQ